MVNYSIKETGAGLRTKCKTTACPIDIVNLPGIISCLFSLTIYNCCFGSYYWSKSYIKLQFIFDERIDWPFIWAAADAYNIRLQRAGNANAHIVNAS